MELTHVVDLSVTAQPENTLAGLSISEMRHEGAEKLEQLLNDFSGTRAKINMLEAFSLPETILLSAKNSTADLIVMGTASKHGLEKLILGSTAETVIRKSTCPCTHDRSACRSAIPGFPGLSEHRLRHGLQRAGREGRNLRSVVSRR